MKAEHMFMIFMVLVNLYLILPRLCWMKEYNAVQGASANNIDETAWVNLHAILHELYNSGTLTIPGNLNVVGNIVSGGDITAGRNMIVGDEAGRAAGGGYINVRKIHHGGNTGVDTGDQSKIQVWSPLELSAGKALYVREIYDISNGTIRFHDHVHFGWQKTVNVGSGGLLEVEGHTILAKGLKLPGIKNQAANSALKPSGEATKGWVFDDNNWTLKVGN